MNPILKYSLIVLAVVVLLVVTLGVSAGSIVKRYINNNGPSLVGRVMHTDGASVNLFTGSLHLDSLCIAEPDGQTPFLSIRQFDAKLSVLKLLSGVYDLDDVRVDQLRVDIQQQDTVFNFSDILAFLGEEEDEEPLPLVLRNIKIVDSSIHYQDLLVHSDFQINDFSLFIPGVDLRDINTSVGVQLSLVDGGQLTTNIDYDERQQTYKVFLQLTDFNLQSILPYVRQQIAFGEMAGLLNVDVEMKGSLKHMLDFTLRGTAGVRDLNVLDPYGHTMVQCDTVAIGIRDIDLTQNRIELNRVVFDRPFISIAYGKDSLDNFSRLMVQASEQSDSDSTEEAEAAVSFNGKEKDLRLVIDRLAIQKASLRYLDESLIAEPFKYELTEVNFSAPNFTFDGENHITADAKLGETGWLKFKYDGKLTDQRNMKMTVQADGIAFADFSPYTVHMFGNEVTSGTLSVNMLAQTIQGHLIGQNRFILSNPKVEKKRKNIQPEMNVPFRAGMYLLTDRNNVCDIDLPVKGNIDEPRYSYKRAVFSTLGKLVVKMVTSPFRHSGSVADESLSADELLRLDNRSLDDISLDSISSDVLKDE